MFIDLLQVFDYKRCILQANKPVKMCSMEPVISQFILLSPCLSNLDNVMFYFVYSFFFITDLQVFSFVSKMNCRPLSWTIKSLFLYFQFFFQDKVSPLSFKPYHCVGRFSEVQLYFILDATTGMSCTCKFLNSTVKLSNKWDMRSDRQTWQIGNVML